MKSLLKGSVSYTLFSTVESELNSSQVVDNIKERRFVPLKPDYDMSAGWTVFNREMDTRAFNLEDVVLGDSVVLSYRQDNYNVPKSLVRSEAKKTLEAKGGDESSTKMLRIQMNESLVELRKRSLPRSKITKVVWDRQANQVRIFGNGAQLERIVTLFERTFGVALKQQTPFERFANSQYSEQKQQITPIVFFA